MADQERYSALMHDGYERDGIAIYRQSFAIIREEADLSGFPGPEADVVVRMIHACGQTDLPAEVSYTPGVVETARAALRAGAPILADTAMVASGVTRKRLPADNSVVCTLSDSTVVQRAEQLGTTRTAAAVDLWEDIVGGAVVAIGNAPTALFHLLERIDGGWPAPAAIVGGPVGFVGATESKEALIASGLPHLIVRGRRGGSAITAAAVNAIASTQL
ncbi:Precorrin-8X methylmutase [Hoyosella subflava DQS3-9A1]|uniref:Precorrin-8X methylmutase n=2 Tax=Hoyosella TaxID=697025 RepID=F6EP19_HOYSD|nr:Precorrin-8X methylmutase [Hoyosella subflava DQS3-9A1]